MSQGLLRVIYWRLLRAVGLARMSWDKQFEAGVWCRTPPGPHTVSKVVELCNGGYLLEFGCGEGTLPLALPKNSFSAYIGYDISDVAVRRAKERARAAGLTACQFEQCDMAHWQGSSGISLVLVEECLYYLTQTDAANFLRCCCKSLLPGGSILVIVHSAAKHFRTVDVCGRVCSVREEFVVDGRTYLVLTGKQV